MNDFDVTGYLGIDMVCLSSNGDARLEYYEFFAISDYEEYYPIFQEFDGYLGFNFKNEKFDADPFIVELAENDEIAAAYATFEL